MERLWEEYKESCDSYKAVAHEFCRKTGAFVSAKINKPITYTIEGFCLYIGLDRSAFYDTYDTENSEFSNIVTRVREECEINARIKFETGQIPTQLSGLWMSKYGYTTSTNSKVEVEQEVKTQVVIALPPKDSENN